MSVTVLTTSNVKTYCRVLFSQAELDSFDWWWVNDDQALDGAPVVLVNTEPRAVIARAEEICR